MQAWFHMKSVFNIFSLIFVKIWVFEPWLHQAYFRYLIQIFSLWWWLRIWIYIHIGRAASSCTFSMAALWYTFSAISHKAIDYSIAWWDISVAYWKSSVFSSIFKIFGTGCGFHPTFEIQLQIILISLAQEQFVLIT